ncbi:unnamed protein product, partial [Meganyctiphanes norvegica]|uniref:RGS domain-containing protein n=1 Tax=Meganyctiphanes norvegica TaxID=48144 RepID=A0AAV2SFV0_MEGNR
MVSKEQRQKWKSSVSSLLNDPFGLQTFREFLEKRKDEAKVQVVLNCIDFYEECEHHKKLKTVEELSNSGKSIYSTYLEELADKEIPAIGESRNESRKVGEKLENQDLPKKDLETLFNGAQENVCQFISDGGTHQAFCRQLNVGNTSVCTLH